MVSRFRSWWVRRQVVSRGGRPLGEKPPEHDLTGELEAAGIPVQRLSVDRDAFEKFIESAMYAERPYYEYGRLSYSREKYLEHYVSLLLLDPRPGEVLVDIASMDSPFPEIASDLYGLFSYRQDITYPEGIHGQTIGSDAASMPVSEGFASHLTAHCSFEHFAGPADSGFIEEAGRVLQPGGKLCLLPLYLSSAYWIQLHVRRWRRSAGAFEPGDAIYLADEWVPPFSRFYDVPTLLRRVVAHLGDLRLKVYRLANAHELGADCHLTYVALFEKASLENGPTSK